MTKEEIAEKTWELWCGYYRGGGDDLDHDEILTIIEKHIAEYAEKEVSEANSNYKTIEWISVKDRLPEDLKELIIKPNDELSPTKTKRVLTLTNTGSITDNRRLKMQVGEKQWTWLMGYDGEDVIKWAEFEDPAN